MKVIPKRPEIGEEDPPLTKSVSMDTMTKGVLLRESLVHPSNPFSIKISG